MHLVLDQNGPLYLQVARAIKSAIDGGRIPPGARLRPTRGLAQDLGISRRTVVAAFELLQAEGLIAGRIGSGSFVNLAVGKGPRPVLRQRAVPPQCGWSRRARQACNLRNPANQTAPIRFAFDIGMPSLDTSLPTAWAREIKREVPYVRPSSGAPEGMPVLREAICAHLADTRGVRCDPDDILIVNGMRQAVSLTARVLLDAGDRAVIEEPHHHATRRILEMHGAAIAGVPVDREGMRCDLLHDDAKLIFATPEHQFPTGWTLGQQRRELLLAHARRTGGWIFENAYDGEFRSEAALPALFSLDEDFRVVYAGTFSNAIVPSLQVGYLIVPPGLRQDFANAKWAEGVGTASMEQSALANLLRSGTYERHARMNRRRIASMWNTFERALRRDCGRRICMSSGRGGLHLLIEVPAIASDLEDALIQLARERRIGLHSARPCFLDPPDHVALLLGYGSMSAKDVNEAARLLAACIEDVLARSGHRKLPRHAGAPRVEPAACTVRSSAGLGPPSEPWG